jgi:hypothetical protein
MTQAFGRAVALTSGKPHLLDSNKETARGLFLLRFQPDARVIHLVRDPRQVQRSHYWRIASGRGFRFMRRQWEAGSWTAPLWLLLAAFSWTVGNMLCELAKHQAPGRTLRLRYEDLCHDPVSTVRRIGAVLDLPLEDVARRLEEDGAFTAGHNVGGNPIRHQRELYFNARIAKEQSPLPFWLDAATSIICWPLMRRYDYGPREQHREASVANQLRSSDFCGAGLGLLIGTWWFL